MQARNDPPRRRTIREHFFAALVNFRFCPAIPRLLPFLRLRLGIL